MEGERKARVWKVLLRPTKDFGMVRVLDRGLRGGGREAIGAEDLKENGVGFVDDRREEEDEKAMTKTS